MFCGEIEKDTLKIDTEPVRVQVLSEPYVVFNRFGYAPVIDVWVKKRKREYIMYLSAKSLGQGIEAIRQSNQSGFKGLEFWIRKETAEKTSKYMIDE
jgi:hypothetical protein